MRNLSILFLTLFFMSCKAQKNPKFDYIINKKDVLEIKLESNPTTGYSWKWIKSESNKMLDSIDAIYVPTKVSNGVVGSGGTEIFKFKANKSGIESLTFEYCRSWEQHSAVTVKKFIIKVK
ncbi:protease inhibitor I42 family protein [Flavobacterium sp. ZT3R18]|uniref:protease inhibitor I42 family protein n=1 Tax=Flavobacterium sp. ZT3R18 TaxID=2594429 RepID=UPI00163DB92A|nr:protease inhibitor I42 family protein [Flavobacterium sp. ZT3R18]